MDLSNNPLAELERTIDAAKEPRERADTILQASTTLTGQGKQAEILHLNQQAIKIYEELGDKNGMAEALVNAGNACNELADHAAAFDFYTRALGIYEETGEKVKIVSTLNLIGSLHSEEHEYTQALPLHEKALELSKAIDNKTGIAYSHLKIANVYFSKGSYRVAIENIDIAAALFAAIKDQKGQAFCFNQLAVVKLSEGDYAAGLDNLQKAAIIFEKTGDANGLGFIWNSMGNTHRLTGNQPLALEFYRKALDIRERIGNIKLTAITITNIGTAYYEMDDYIQAIIYFNRGLEICEKVNYKNGRMKCLVNLGNIQVMQGKHDMALQSYQEVLDLSREAGYTSGIISGCLHIAYVYVEQQKYDEAHELLKEAITISIETGQKEMEKDSVYMQYELEKKRGNFAAALEYHEKYTTLKEAFISADSAKKIANLKINYELELNENERKLIEKILFNTLPPAIATRIKNGEEKIVERFDDASVLFADIVDFTKWSTGRNVQEIALTLSTLFEMFDELAEQYKVEKIKTIGDAYMCVSGLPEPCADHAERMANMALAMNEKIKTVLNGRIELRIGIHTGEVIAGVIGKNKYAYDLWGDTVNTASRMESHGQPGKIQVSDAFKERLMQTPWAEFKFDLEERGEVNIKGKGAMHTWFLTRHIPA